MYNFEKWFPRKFHILVVIRNRVNVSVRAVNHDVNCPTSVNQQWHDVLLVSLVVINMHVMRPCLP